MKKGFVTLSILLFLALAGSIPVKADSIVVNGSYKDTDSLSQADYDELQNTALLLEYLRQGGVIDTSNVSNDYSVSDLISDFGNFVKEVVPDIIDVINPFQSKFEYTPLGNSMLNNNIYKFLGKLPFYALSGTDEPTVNPDPDFQNQLDIINGDGFYFKNWNTAYGMGYDNGNYTLSSCAKAYPYHQYSWFGINDIIDTGNPNTARQVYGVANITDVNIYFDGNDYNLTVSPNYLDNQFSSYDYAPSYYFNNAYPTYNATTYYQDGVWNTTTTNAVINRNNNTLQRITTYSCSGTLLDIFTYCCKYFKNVNIYVDGVPWSIVGTSSTPSLIIYNDTVPDIATNDYGYVHWVYDYEIFFRIDQIWDLLTQLINRTPEPSDPTTTIIKWTDLDDVIVDVDGQPALAVKIYTPSSNIDDDYWDSYGPIIPVFVPLFTPVINDSDILNIATTPMQAIPQDIIDVFAYIFIGGLFVCFIHRLLE